MVHEAQGSGGRVNGEHCCRYIRRWVATLAGLVLMSSGVGHAFDESVLWLPARYQQKLAPDLRRAAMKVEAEARCERIMRGTLHDSSVYPDQVRFLFVCRDESLTTFPVVVDGQTLELTYREEGSVSAEKAVGDSDIARGARLKQISAQCEALLQKNTRYMKELQLLPELNEPASISEEGDVTMSYAFDAKTPRGDLLRYRARCESKGTEEAAMVISSREDRQAAQ